MKVNPLLNYFMEIIIANWNLGVNSLNLMSDLNDFFPAFRKLDPLYGTWRKESKKKKNYNLPMPKMTNTDLARILKCDEIQSVIKPPK